MSGIYISWPFCSQKCTYCNFASGVQPHGLEARYLGAVVSEMKAATLTDADTLYIGGGTPSAMEPGGFAELLGPLPHEWAEATVEAAPGTLTPDRVAAWSKAGMNRVSLGVQSFVKQELARTGRRHDADTVIRDVALLREYGITNLNIDLIAGLPGQTEASWRTSLDTLASLNVPHVSVYMLEVDEDSRLGSEIILGGKRYGALDVPPEDRIADFYEQATRHLTAIGIHRYEISNFSRPGFESLHNLKYWRREPYRGLGSDAHSFDGKYRYQNVETAVEYVERSEKGGGVCVARVEPDAQEEKFFVGLRLAEGIEPSAEDEQRYGAGIEKHLAAGTLERLGNRLRLTDRGIMVSNEVFGEFVNS